MTVKVRFDGHAFVPEQPVDLPVGTIGEIVLAQPARAESSTTSPLRDLLRIVDRDQPSSDAALPEDPAGQHGHYLYGTLKRPLS